MSRPRSDQLPAQPFNSKPHHDPTTPARSRLLRRILAALAHQAQDRIAPARGQQSHLAAWSGLTWVLSLIVAITLWRLLVADLLPVSRDEAYYFNWAAELAWGYFDHPPAVAVLGLGAQLAPASSLAARLGAIALGSIALLVLWRLYRASGLVQGKGLLLALILSASTLPGLVAGVITTPDTLLALFWPLALHEALRALQGHRARWLTAGIATGLGLLGKYTMVMIGPIFLWALWRRDPDALRTPWPYLGGLVALLVFAPNLIWNAHNDWLTLRFQFGHGFSVDSGPISIAGDALPAVTGVNAYSIEPPAPMDFAERLSSLGGFLGEQLLFWGLLLIPITMGLWRLSQQGTRDRDRLAASLDPAAVSLLGAATLIPLGLFALVALGSEVEANWAAPYLVGAAPFVALLIRRWARWGLLAAVGNLLLTSVYVLYVVTAFPPLPDSAARGLRESGGFKELATYVAELPAPVIADRYQFAAMLNFYQPRLSVSQWPGITRPSEYGRGRIEPLPDLEALQQSGFWLVARKFSAPEISGFESIETRSLFSCPDGSFTALDGPAAWTAGGCDDPANVWRLYRYRPAPVAEAAVRGRDPDA